MSDNDDKKLPVRYHKTETAPTRVDDVHAPATGHSFLQRIFSGFISDLNKATLQRNTTEIKARTDHAHAVAELHDALMERDRKIEHYLQHRDDIIADDHDEHLDRMAANRGLRALAREEREHQNELARQRRQQEHNQALFASATTRFGLDMFNKTLPDRQEQLGQKAKIETLDAEIEMLMRVKDVNQSRKSETTQPAPPQTDALEKMLAELDHEIEVAHGTNQSDDVKSALYAFRSRVSALIENEKNKSR